MFAVYDRLPTNLTTHEMSSTPVLSYKKPSSNTSSQPSSPVVGGSGPSSPKLPSVGASQGRNVLMRRKALQDFYKLQQGDKEISDKASSIATAEASQEEAKLENKQVNLNSPDEFNSYIREHPIEDILRLRNSITSQLNSQDLAKKSIVYDNYYELIKLNQVLEGLSAKGSKGTETTAPDALGIFSSKVAQEKAIEVTDQYLDQVFEELSTFVTNDVDSFKKLFEEIVSSFHEENDTDSTASIRALSRNESDSIPESIDKAALSKEIHSLLASNKASLDDDTKKAYRDSIQSILGSLNHHKDEILILQLNDVKKMYV